MNNIDNLDLIKPLLSFDSELDFYWIKILKRKKDCPDDIKNTTQSVRTIKNYYIGSVGYLDDKYSEITELCSHFSARAYIELNTKNHKSVTLKMLSLLSDKIGYEQYNQSNLFEKAIGLSSSKDKKFILDIDDKDETIMDEIKKELNVVTQFKGDKLILAEIPTKSGYHIITKPFNSSLFKNKFPDIEIKKNNPTLLYLPESLNL